MIINKYLAKTEKDAIEKAKEDLGANAIVMNVKKVRPKGIMRIFLRPKVEVTAALDENINYQEDSVKPERSAQKPAGGAQGQGSRFDVSIPAMDAPPPIDKQTDTKTQEKLSNEERLSQLFSLLEKQMEEKTGDGGVKASERSSVTRPVEPARTEVPSSAPVDDKKQVSTEHVKTAPDASVSEEEKDKKSPDTDSDKDKSEIYRDLVYKQLIGNEVDPEIVARILDEAKRSLPKDAAVDQILGSVYQRIILMIGQPYTIDYKPNQPTKFVFFLGSTGVGKTTTIAKLASKLKLEENCNIALVTADTYRVAAVEQLKVYADILDVPLHVIYHPEELAGKIDQLDKYDIVLVDTAGCSHKNREQIKDVSTLLEQVPISKRQVYLALSVGTKYKDLLEIAKVYSDITDYSIIFTKLDETSSAGVMLNMKVTTKCPLSYVTNGQNVPDDIATIDAQAVAKQLLS